MLRVSNALYEFKKGLAFGKGSKIFRLQSDGYPDWGLGISGRLIEGMGTLQNSCLGDVKVSSKWNSKDLLGTTDWINYLDDPYLVNCARPLEQTQHYGMSPHSRYA